MAKTKAVKAEASHWADQKELSAGYGALKLMLIISRLLPPLVFRLLAFPVSLGYYLFSARARGESRRFLEKISVALSASNDRKEKFRPRPFRHILSFALTLVEKTEAWAGKIPFGNIHFQHDDIRSLIEILEGGKGALLICSHLGNAELLRGLAHFNRTGVSRTVPVTSITDFSVTPHFNRMLEELNPGSMLRIISANSIGPDTLILLQDRIAAGELVVIAGDRTSSNTRDKYLEFPFLGETAPFAYGVFFLAALLNAPAYFIFGLRKKDISLKPEYNMYVHKSPISFDVPRRQREERIRELAGAFARKLEDYCKRYPYQWYNFYNFWSPDTQGSPK